MDISHEAYLYPFSIGPSTLLGRTIAFKILFCKSMSHFRQRVFNIFMIFICKVKKYLAPKLWWLHPTNPQGILTIVALLIFLLKRYGNLKVRAKSAYRRKFWRNMMRMALTYEEWAHAAKMIDRETPKIDESHLYDEELVRNKLQELKHRRQEGSLRDIMFFMRADLFRNLGNMCNPELHKGRLQMPDLIKEYIIEVSMQLRMVCESDSEDLVLEEKLAFMHETRHAFGRTALLLSGGASLGAFHVGVVKTLIEHKLLPRIIAGSSAGSVICAVVATRSWPELQSFFEDSWYSLSFFDQMGGIFTVVKRVMRHGAIHEIRSLQILLRNLTCNLTFQEAYDLTGRVLGITVCSPRKHEPSRLLNYLTSPHVVIWSAVTASCAFPGLFEAQELMAKNRSGELVSYHPPFNLDLEEGLPMPARRWRDGGLENDLPKMQLKELFNVNHFIVSQANPHTSAILRLKEFLRAYGGNFAAKLAHIAEMEVKHRCNQMLEVGIPFRGLAKVFAQDWEGDITVVVPATPAQYFKLIQNMTQAELQKAANQGRRCIWEKLSAIKAHCGIELALDECVAILNHMRRLKRSAERAAAAGIASSTLHSRFSAPKRIPSWNCISRENSIASLEDLAGDHWPPRGRTTEGGNSDTEAEDHTTSWTCTGGPLMRTSSADTFVDFFRALDSEIGSSTGRRSLMKVNVSPNQSLATQMQTHQTQMELDQRSIVVPEGDLLQPEKIHNGIMFNVVRREGAPTVSSHNNDWLNQCDRCCGEEEEVVMDITSVPESGDSDMLC